MFSINTNASALTALQALQQTQQALSQTQQQVSTGYSVNSAADNASYFSIATQLKADSGIVNASNSALSETQAILKTASPAISSVLTTINSIPDSFDRSHQPWRQHHSDQHAALGAWPAAGRRGDGQLCDGLKSSRWKPGRGAPELCRRLHGV